MKAIVDHHRRDLSFEVDDLVYIKFSNLVQHSQPKRIRHHFIRNLVEDRVIEIKHIPIERQINDIFTQDIDAYRFEAL